MRLHELVNLLVGRMRERYARVEGAVHVHDLCACSHKAEMRSRYPELEELQRYRPAILVGELVHTAVETLCEECGLQPGQRLEAEVEGLGVLTGLPDLVDDEAVYEIKFQRALPNQLPKPHHTLQARVYAWMTGRRVARLWYVSPDGFREYELQPLTEEELRRHVEAWRSRRPLWPEWECKYCVWRELCERGG